MLVIGSTNDPSHAALWCVADDSYVEAENKSLREEASALGGRRGSYGLRTGMQSLGLCVTKNVFIRSSGWNRHKMLGSKYSFHFKLKILHYSTASCGAQEKLNPN